MNIYLERTFSVRDNEQTVANRLGRWSMKYGLSCTQDRLGNWEYSRGTPLQAAYTFDVRKIPTTVKITMDSGPSPVVHISFRVKSWLSLETGGDKKRVEEQMDVLEAYIKGTFEE